MDTPALRGVNNTGGSTQRQVVSCKQIRRRQLLTQPLTAQVRLRQLLTQPLTAPLPGGMATQLSQEVVENDLQTDPENHLHQPHLNTPIITLSPPTVMNSLPISLYSHTLCSGTSRHLDP